MKAMFLRLLPNGKKLYIRAPAPGERGAYAASVGPTIAEMTANFAGAVAEWVKRGLPVVDRATFEARLAACRACDLWDERARFGMGKCLHKKCGCTKLKHWLATSRCPAGLW